MTARKVLKAQLVLQVRLSQAQLLLSRLPKVINIVKLLITPQLLNSSHHLAHKARLVLKASKALKEILVKQAPKVILVRQALKATQVNVVHKAK